MRFLVVLASLGVLWGLPGCDAPATERQAPPTLTTENPAPAAPPWEAWGKTYPSWVEPVTPFKVIGNVHYVGVSGLASYLITSEDGHILIDGGLPQNAPMIARNIETLGFDITDVKMLLNTHAHFDHSGGLAALKEMSGAVLIASEGDRSALEGGFYLGAEDKLEYSAPPVKVDQIVADGERVGLDGRTQLTARLTPGHTRGCTSWTFTVQEAGETYDALIFCSASVAANTLVPPQYEGIVEDYRYTFETTRDWAPDVFLSNHPFFFGMTDKRAKLEAGDALAFVDRDGFQALMARLEPAFEAALEQAEAAAQD